MMSIKNRYFFLFFERLKEKGGAGGSTEVFGERERNFRIFLSDFEGRIAFLSNGVV